MIQSEIQDGPVHNRRTKDRRLPDTGRADILRAQPDRNPTDPVTNSPNPIGTGTPCAVTLSADPNRNEALRSTAALPPAKVGAGESICATPDNATAAPRP